MAKFCVQCGDRLTEGFKFCKSCGASLDVPPRESVSETPVQPQTVLSEPVVNAHSIEIPKYNFSEAMESGFTNSFKFTGRSSRSAYWYFTLGLLFINIGIGVITSLFEGYALMQLLYWGSYILIIPSLSSHTRRLHDVNKSGWNYLWHFTIIGMFYVLYLLVQPSDAANKYGEHAIRPGD